MKSQEFEFGKSDDYYCGNFYNFLDKDKAVILAKKCDTFLKNNGFKKFRKVIINSEFDSDNYRETWYIAADVCKLLGITNTSRAVKNFDIDEKRKVRLRLRGGWYNIVSEAGVYRLVKECRKPEAKKFQDYYYKYILPDIAVNGYKTFTPVVDNYIASHPKYSKMSVKKLRALHKQIDKEILQSEINTFCFFMQNKSFNKSGRSISSMSKAEFEKHLENCRLGKLAVTRCAMIVAFSLMYKCDLYEIEECNSGYMGMSEIRRTYSKYGWVSTYYPIHKMYYSLESDDCLTWSVDTLWFKGDMYDVFDLLNVGGDIKKLHVKQNISSTGVILKGVN